MVGSPESGPSAERPMSPLESLYRSGLGRVRSSSGLPGVHGVAMCGVGVWLLAAPFVLGYRYGGAGVSATIVDIVVGLVLIGAGIALVRWSGRSGILGAATALVGALLMLAPFVFDYNDGDNAPRATTNALICGLVVVIASLVQVAAVGVPPRQGT